MTTAPSTVITNSVARAVVQLPDPVNGFYRATRFDWAGIISSLTACGHEFFGPWREIHDPFRHDCITGLAEEFHAFPEPDIDYAFARPGGEFLRLGVGLLRKPATASGEDTSAFERFHTYELVDACRWDVICEATAVHFRHTAQSPTGLAYIYEKTVRLLNDEPTLVLEHCLTNTGDRPICTYHYNHNFFRIHGDDPGDDLVLRLLFPVHFAGHRPELLNIQNSVVPDFLQEISLRRALRENERVLTEMYGFEITSAPYKMALHHRRARASVAISSDRPLSRFLFWATNRTFCPEPYVKIIAPCGALAKWTLRYEFSNERNCSDSPQ